MKFTPIIILFAFAIQACGTTKTYIPIEPEAIGQPAHEIFWDICTAQKDADALLCKPQAEFMRGIESSITYEKAAYEWRDTAELWKQKAEIKEKYYQSKEAKLKSDIRTWKMWAILGSTIGVVLGASLAIGVVMGAD